MTWRNLKRNHSCAIPRRMVFLDTETIREKRHSEQIKFSHRLRCGHAIYLRIESGRRNRRDEIAFDSSERFFGWLEGKLDQRATLWLVGHKIGFDLTIVGLWEAMDSGLFTLDAPRAKRPILDDHGFPVNLQRGICVIDDPPTIIGLRHKDGGRLIIVDTLNWFRQPLKQIGDDIGLPKLDMPSQDAPLEEWETYCKRDVEIVERLFKGLIDFTREHDHGMFRYTAPSQALHIYRHKYLKTDIVLHDELDVKALERKAYFGGELRQFFVGPVNEHVYQVDVNSLFPFVMRGNHYPRKLVHSDMRDDVKEPSSVFDWKRSVAEVKLDTLGETFPFRHEKETVYPSGYYVTTLCGPELEYAARKCKIYHVRNTASYAMADLFTEFVDELFALRKQYKAAGNRSYEQLCKLLANSLYGKFGQLSFRWVHEPNKIAPRKWYRWLERNLVDKTVELYRSVGNDAFRCGQRTETDSSFPAIAAWVTSYARLYMRSLRQLCGVHNVYYQATDSLAVNKAGYEALLFAGYLSDDRLGGLRLVREGAVAEFRGPNNYTIGSDDVRAGVRATAVRLNDKQWYQENFERLESVVARDPNDCIYSYETIFTDTGYDRKLNAHGRGWREPLLAPPKSSDWH